MFHDATVASGFLICPPLDYPLRLRGRWGGPKIESDNFSAFNCSSDHFASVHREGLAGWHRIHEAVDLESGEGSCVFSAYAGTIAEVNAGNVLINHHNGSAAFATRYLHVVPVPMAVGVRVNKGQIIAKVAHNDAGDHLHFELWHWVSPNPGVDTDREAVPIDPTRMLYRWEVELELDYAVLGNVDATVSAALDGGAWTAPINAAYRSARLPNFTSPAVQVLAAGAVWRIAEGTVSHLLRLEGPFITVIDEAYGSRSVQLERIDEIGVIRRRSFPTFVLKSGDATYAVPLHQATEGERERVSLLRTALDREGIVELDVRRSAFWAMDGSVDDVSAVIEGVRLRT